MSARASPVETAVEPMVCRSVCGVMPGNPAFATALGQTRFVPW